MPVSRISVAGFCSAKLGALRWMGQCGTSSTGPLPSMGRPRGSNMRPSVASPTGAVRPWPVAFTVMPLPRPSLAESMMQRTVVSLTCCATSMVRSVPSADTVSASCRAGSLPAVNCTSTTGPATRIIVPCIIRFASCNHCVKLLSLAFARSTALLLGKLSSASDDGEVILNSVLLPRRR